MENRGRFCNKFLKVAYLYPYCVINSLYNYSINELKLHYIIRYNIFKIMNKIPTKNIWMIQKGIILHIWGIENLKGKIDIAAQN